MRTLLTTVITITSELHRKYALLDTSELSQIVSVLHDLRHDRLDLINLRHRIRVQQHVVTLFNRSNDLRQCQLGWHELFEAFLRLIDFIDSFTVFISAIQGTSQLFLLLLTESKDLPLSVSELFGAACAEHSQRVLV